MFLKRGWSFFYKTVLALLLTYQEELLRADELSDILLIFKGSINNNIQISPKSQRRRKINWDEIFRRSERIEIDEAFISSLHTRFDIETRTFNVTSESRKAVENHRT